MLKQHAASFHCCSCSPHQFECLNVDYVYVIASMRVIAGFRVQIHCPARRKRRARHLLRLLPPNNSLAIEMASLSKVRAGQGEEDGDCPISASRYSTTQRRLCGRFALEIFSQGFVFLMVKAHHTQRLNPTLQIMLPKESYPCTEVAIMLTATISHHTYCIDLLLPPPPTMY